MFVSRTHRLILGIGALVALAACSNDNSGTNPTPVITIAKATPSGDGQSGTVGQTLPNPLQVLVQQNSAPMAGATVTWATGSGSGSVAPTSSTTDANGLATTAWTLGTTVGPQTATATMAGAQGSPVQFSATAAAPGGATGPTVTLQGTSFTPATLTVPVGTTVTWQWVNGSHNIAPVPPGTAPSSPAVMGPGSSYQFTFTAAGTYRYFCQVHGALDASGNPIGMNGTIIVQ